IIITKYQLIITTNRSFYSLSKKSIDLLGTLGLNAVKEEFRALFKQMT
ncbi:unnamed protein product, partial [marine sediment metagenome]